MRKTATIWKKLHCSGYGYWFCKKKESQTQKKIWPNTRYINKNIWNQSLPGILQIKGNFKNVISESNYHKRVRVCTNAQNVWIKFERLFIKSIESLVQEEFTRPSLTFWRKDFVTPCFLRLALPEIRDASW